MANPSRFVVLPHEEDDESYYVVIVDSHVMNVQDVIRQAPQLGLDPVSGIHVGAAGRGSSDKIYLGINVEFQGLPLDYSIHAEQFLLVNLMLHSEERLYNLAVSSSRFVFETPCNKCLDLLNEIEEAPEMNIYEKNGEHEPHRHVKLKGLIAPRSRGSLLDSKRDKGLILSVADPTRLQREALAAANKSYAPYSKCRSGVALRDGRGNVYVGSYVEGCNKSSIGPVEAALVHFVVSSGSNIFMNNEIVEAVLVEKKDAKISQENTARMILDTITNIKLQVFHYVKPRQGLSRFIMGNSSSVTKK